MANLTRSLTIDRPAERVFAFLEDPAAVSKCLEDVVRIEPLTEGPMRAGSRFKATRLNGKREASTVIEVREHEGPRQGKAPPYHHRAGGAMMGLDAFYDLTFRALDSAHTRIDVIVEIKATNMFGRMLVGTAAKSAEKLDEEMLDRLKLALEEAMG